MNIIRRKFNGIMYDLKHTRYFEMGKSRYKDTYWKEVLEAEPGVRRQTLNIVCRIPEGFEDVDMATLKEDCIDFGHIVTEPVFIHSDDI